ncbi:hypothetical protein B1A_00907 [mine drainage metagenome]|uniref:Uncharacterized protein n=1 Tax=mine drainage metagenome TaxID=410659 RepID=T1C4L1_9ZZZZ
MFAVEKYGGDYERVFRNHPVVFLKNGNREENPSFGMAYFDRMGLSEIVKAQRDFLFLGPRK